MKTHQIFRVLLVAALFQFIALVSSAQVTIYATIKGQKQGDIKGSVTTKGLEDAIECTAFSTQDISPRDAASGLPAGKRMHKPIVITTQFDKATPLLLNSLYTNENLEKVVIKFFRAGTNGIATNFATITLTNANLAQIDQSVDRGTTAAEKPGPYIVKLSLVYQKIEITQGTTGGEMASDSWNATN
jgi:type VI secretion system secreted protein Hcp